MTCDDPGLKRQAKMLMSMIDYAIRRLGNLPELIPKLKNLGKRHFVNYNVKPEHFQVCILSDNNAVVQTEGGTGQIELTLHIYFNE